MAEAAYAWTGYCKLTLSPLRAVVVSKLWSVACSQDLISALRTGATWTYPDVGAALVVCHREGLSAGFGLGLLECALLRRLLILPLGAPLREKR